MKYANLHLHSTFSDAQFTPEQLLLIGKSLGYGAMALTDHETDGGVRRLMKYAREQGGVDVISGVEFCGSYEGTEPHITALDYDMDNNDFRAFVKDRLDKREECTRKRFEIGIRDGIIQGITWNDVLDVAEENSSEYVKMISDKTKAFYSYYYSLGEKAKSELMSDRQFVESHLGTKGYEMLMRYFDK
jgi:DNA polymerase III alpha subunit